MYQQATVVAGDPPRGNGEIFRLQLLAQRAQIDIVGGDAIGIEVDADFRRFDAAQLHLRYAFDAFQRAFQGSVQEFVCIRQVLLRRDAQLQDWRIRRDELENVDAQQVFRQFVANGIQLVANLDGFHADVIRPAEENEDAAAIASGVGLHAFDAAHGRDDFFHRADNQPFDLFR